MLRTIITIFLVIAVLILAFYFLIWKPSKAPNQSEPRPSHDGTLPTDTEPPTPPVSVKVNASDVASGLPLNLMSVKEDNIASYNISKTALPSPMPLIHFETAFANACPKYVWYKNNYYVFIEDKTSTQGVKTCYYKFNKSLFPNQMRVQSLFPPYACGQYKYYISGVEYVYSQAIIEGGNLQTSKHFCVYIKK